MKKRYASDNHSPTPLLPYLCDGQAILALVLVGELLALILVLAGSADTLSWERLGAVSMTVQWIILSSALVLCQLRSLLNRFSPMCSGFFAYMLCLLIAAVVLAGAPLLVNDTFKLWAWANSMVIAAIFSGILLRYLYIQQQLINQQQAELRSRLQSLQSRIRPHFLFNSMNTIASLISIDPERAEQAVENLSELFRSSLQEMGLIRLEEELAICRRYIDIESMRLADRLTMVWDIEIPVPSVFVPSLLLQPLLENAIVHGIQRLPKGGKVVFTVMTVDKTVAIVITNPIPILSAKQMDKGQQLALKNIHSRLQLHYGNNACLTVEKDKEHFSIQLILPKPISS